MNSNEILFGCICGGVGEALIALIIVCFSFIMGYVVPCREKCCKDKRKIDQRIEEYSKIGR